MALDADLLVVYEVTNPIKDYIRGNFFHKFT